MLFKKLLSLLFIFVLFVLLIVPAALVMGAVTGVLVFFGAANNVLFSLLSQREQMLNGIKVSKTLKKIIKKNIIDIGTK